jgi:hypothetical protein
MGPGIGYGQRGRRRKQLSAILCTTLYIGMPLLTLASLQVSVEAHEVEKCHFANVDRCIEGMKTRGSWRSATAVVYAGATGSSLLDVYARDWRGVFKYHQCFRVVTEITSGYSVMQFKVRNANWQYMYHPTFKASTSCLFSQ